MTVCRATEAENWGEKKKACGLSSAQARMCNRQSLVSSVLTLVNKDYCKASAVSVSWKQNHHPWTSYTVQHTPINGIKICPNLPQSEQGDTHTLTKKSAELRFCQNLVQTALNQALLPSTTRWPPFQYKEDSRGQVFCHMTLCWMLHVQFLGHINTSRNVLNSQSVVKERWPFLCVKHLRSPAPL